MSPRQSRFERNQDLFRVVNERIAELAVQWGGRDDLEVVCECANTGCAAALHVSLEEYKRVRECPGWFLIVPGHLLADAEYVIEHHDVYDIVKVQALTGAPEPV